MAGNSPPRRSSRARTVQSQSTSLSQHSSATSSLSGRPERATRSLNKAASPQKSSPSLSDEPPEESVASTDDIPTRRRRTRAQEIEEGHDRAPSRHTTIEMAGDPDEIQEDDEAVRCICGFDDYPGAPPAHDDKKHVSKDSIDVGPVLPSEIADDVAGFFVQCDICKIWQHGACVGIMSEEASPEEYFCEECRKDLHRIHMASNGQKYSTYLPLVRRKSTTRSRSPKHHDTKESRETRSGRQSSLTQASKRRSTMNSRDAAYDEEEELRRAIEASKEETIYESSESNQRRTKRGRSDSEEKPESAKRQRTKSKSPSPMEVENDQELAGEDSEDVVNRNGSKKPRSGLTRTQSTQKERSEREERERQRAEAAKKRSGRAERRRADGSTPASTILVKGLETQVDTDSDPSEELPLALRAAAHRSTAEKATTTAAAAAAAAAESKAEAKSAPEPPPPSSQPAPDTPPAIVTPTLKPKRTKKKGRNQYTKDREAREETSPARSQSRDAHGHDGGHTHHGRPEGSSKSHSRAKGGFNTKVSMTDLRRKAHAMLDYISRTQIEMAGEITPPNDESRRPSDNTAPSSMTETATSAGEKPSSSQTATNGNSGRSTDASKDFKDLSAIEMMDHLTRDLVKWQKEFA